jgi:putative transcriptional regulator
MSPSPSLNYHGKFALHARKMAPDIVNRVKELRTTRGWTQEQLADAVGVSRQSINSIERDRYVPSLQLALTFARVFGCSTDEIFTLSSFANGNSKTAEAREDE